MDAGWCDRFTNYCQRMVLQKHTYQREGKEEEEQRQQGHHQNNNMKYKKNISISKMIGAEAQ